MRISDWSSDVCSSDLLDILDDLVLGLVQLAGEAGAGAFMRLFGLPLLRGLNFDQSSAVGPRLAHGGFARFGIVDDLVQRGARQFRFLREDLQRQTPTLGMGSRQIMLDAQKDRKSTRLKSRH